MNILLLILLSILQTNHQFEITQFKYSDQSEYLNVDDDNYLIIDTDNFCYFEIDPGVGETFMVSSKIRNYKFKQDKRGNIQISCTVKKIKGKNPKLNVMINKKHNENFYTIRIYNKLMDYDITLKANKI